MRVLFVHWWHNLFSFVLLQTISCCAEASNIWMNANIKSSLWRRSMICRTWSQRLPTTVTAPAGNMTAFLCISVHFYFMHIQTRHFILRCGNDYAYPTWTFLLCVFLCVLVTIAQHNIILIHGNCFTASQGNTSLTQLSKQSKLKATTPIIHYDFALHSWATSRLNLQVAVRWSNHGNFELMRSRGEGLNEAEEDFFSFYWKNIVQALIVVANRISYEDFSSRLTIVSTTI